MEDTMDNWEGLAIDWLKTGKTDKSFWEIREMLLDYIVDISKCVEYNNFDNLYDTASYGKYLIDSWAYTIYHQQIDIEDESVNKIEKPVYNDEDFKNMQNSDWYNHVMERLYINATDKNFWKIREMIEEYVDDITKCVVRNNFDNLYENVLYGKDLIDFWKFTIDFQFINDEEYEDFEMEF